MNYFTEQQEQIIRHLKGNSPLSLAELSRSLRLNKSSVDFQLGQLEKDGIIVRKKYSAKKVLYQLADKDEMQSIIANNAARLEQILTSKSIEGIQAYKDLLNLVAQGESDIWGYANLEEKIIPELQETYEKFRDLLVFKKRKDFFTVPDTPKNIELLKDHSRKKEWKRVLIGRVIPTQVINVNCDIYTWDRSAGICSFEHGGFKVTIYDDKATVDLYRVFLKRLFESAVDEEEYLSKQTTHTEDSN